MGMKEEVLRETLKKFAGGGYERLTQFIVNHPSTDLITFDQFCEAMDIISKKISEVINEKKKIADKNLTSVQDSDGKGTTLFVYLGLLEDSIKLRLGTNEK